MILADTSVWVDHLRRTDDRLVSLLEDARIVCHPFVIAEIALGSLRNRSLVLRMLDGLPSLPVARTDEIRRLIEARSLHGRGIGLVDTALLAACLLAPGTTLWTRDRRLRAVADPLGLAAAFP